MSRSLPDRVLVGPVPGSVPSAFVGEVIARAPIAALEADLENAVGLGELHAAERAHAVERSPRRAREFIAGRAALRAALVGAGWTGEGPLLPSDQGRPGVPEGFTGSITHKDGLALAVARRRIDGRTLGIDSEVIGDRERTAIARKVLTKRELAGWSGSWPALLETFSSKESIYKALHPHVPRYIGFLEADLSGGRITMTLEGGEGPFRFAWTLWWEGPEGPHRRLVTLVEARPTS